MIKLTLAALLALSAHFCALFYIVLLLLFAVAFSGVYLVMIGPPCSRIGSALDYLVKIRHFLASIVFVLQKPFCLLGAPPNTPGAVISAAVGCLALAPIDSKMCIACYEGGGVFWIASALTVPGCFELIFTGRKISRIKGRPRPWVQLHAGPAILGLCPGYKLGYKIGLFLKTWV